MSERFILTGFIFNQIFELTIPLTTFLQGVNIDLLGASEYVKLILEKINIFRSEHQFKKLVEDKNTFIASKANELSFTPLSFNRIRRKKNNVRKKIADEQISCPTKNFQVNTYYTIIYIVSTQIVERFNDQSTPLYKDISLFQ